MQRVFGVYYLIARPVCEREREQECTEIYNRDAIPAGPFTTRKRALLQRGTRARARSADVLDARRLDGAGKLDLRG